MQLSKAGLPTATACSLGDTARPITGSLPERQLSTCLEAWRYTEEHPHTQFNLKSFQPLPSSLCTAQVLYSAHFHVQEILRFLSSCQLPLTWTLDQFVLCLSLPFPLEWTPSLILANSYSCFKIPVLLALLGSHHLISMKQNYLPYLKKALLSLAVQNCNYLFMCLISPWNSEQLNSPAYSEYSISLQYTLDTGHSLVLLIGEKQKNHMIHCVFPN